MLNKARNLPVRVSEDDTYFKLDFERLNTFIKKFENINYSNQSVSAIADCQQPIFFLVTAFFLKPKVV